MILTLLAATSGLSVAPLPADGTELKRQVLAADDVLFERAFNQCELDALRDILLPDAEMIHDQAGINRGRDAFMAPVRENICNGADAKPIRKRIEHTIEVYPLYENGRLYGAIEQGQHEFFLREADKPLLLTNRARFNIVWIYTVDGWKLKSTLSWDHLNPIENGPLDADVLEAGFDRHDDFSYMLSAHGVVGESVAIVRDGVIVEHRVAGIAAPGQPTSLDTVYNVASLAKPVSALIALKLADAGLLELDAPLARDYLDPDLEASPWASRVTARMVLNHTTGLPNWRYLDEGGDGRLRFITEPGTEYRYSGEGFEWLRKAVEERTGRSWDELASEFVLVPAGMTSSAFSYPAGRKSRLASRYDAEGGMIAVPPHAGVNAAANFTTTSEDYARFVIYTMNGAGLREPLGNASFEPQIKIDATKSFGLGWQLLHRPDNSPFAAQHSGADAGVRALALAWPDKRQAVVILSNSENAIPTWGLIIEEAFGPDGAAAIRANQPE
jgi:Beta-lactamase class C and other penicillin binding proteins